MRRSDYIISPQMFRRYDPKYAPREFLTKARAAGVQQADEIDDVVAAITNDEDVSNKGLAGHIFEVMLLDAAATDFLSPKHGLNSTYLARKSNQPIVD